MSEATSRGAGRGDAPDVDETPAKPAPPGRTLLEALACGCLAPCAVGLGLAALYSVVHLVSFPRVVRATEDPRGLHAEALMTAPRFPPTSLFGVGLALRVTDAEGTLLLWEQLESDYAFDVPGDLEVERVVLCEDRVEVYTCGDSPAYVVPLPGR